MRSQSSSEIINALLVVALLEIVFAAVACFLGAAAPALPNPKPSKKGRARETHAKHLKESALPETQFDH